MPLLTEISKPMSTGAAVFGDSCSSWIGSTVRISGLILLSVTVSVLALTG